MSTIVSRRAFLQASGALVVGIALPGAGAAQRLVAAESALGKTLDVNTMSMDFSRSAPTEG